MLSCTYLYKPLCFFLADNADAADGIIRTSHHLLHRCLDGIRHHTHRLTAVHRQTRLHADVVVVVGQEDMGQQIVEDVSPILLYKRTMGIAEVVGLFPSGQGGEVERDTRLYTQVATEVREGISQLRQRGFHLYMHRSDILANGLFFLYLHHERDGAHKHSIRLAHTRVATAVIDGRIGHLLLTHQSCKHIAECCLENLIGCEPVVLAPAVNQLATDVC